MLFWVKFICPAGDSSSCAMVVMCTKTSTEFCTSDESPPTYIHSFFHTHFSRSRRLKFSLHTIDPLRHFSSSLELSRHHCHHVLASSDNCMLSVPLSTSDLYNSCWQSGENCQVASAVAFTLLCHAFWFSLKGCFFPSFCRLAHALSARCFPSSRPDTAFIRSCLFRAWFFFSFSSIGSVVMACAR